MEMTLFCISRLSFFDSFMHIGFSVPSEAATKCTFAVLTIRKRMF